MVSDQHGGISFIGGTIELLQLLITSGVIGTVIGAALGFAQFMINRHDTRNDEIKNLKEVISDQNQKIDELDAKLDAKNAESLERSEMHKKGMESLIQIIDGIKDEMQEYHLLREAKEARVRILRFADECRNKMPHSLETFQNVLDDITTYNHFCKTHPLFENERTVSAEKFIRKIYDDCQEKDNFL